MNKTILHHLKPKWTKYIPHKPFVKQRAFLMLPHIEALYGGAAGGGKSDALLMAALQYVDIPGYAALCLRKTLTDLKQEEALLDRMEKWMAPFIANKEIQYRRGEYKFVFPTVDHTGKPGKPATITFGYIGQSEARLRYQGIEVQFVAFDEVTQHKERDYTYLFSRLRKCGCYIHTDKDKDGHPIYNKDCKVCDMMRKIPIRMRGATNPGGPGHTWVRERFGLDVDPDTLTDPHPKFKGFNKDRPFIPSFIQDNKYLDQAQYRKSLIELTEEDREQLEHGNWSFVSSAKFKKTYARYYSDRGDYFFLGQLYKGRSILKNSLVKVFQTVDPASSSKEGMGDQELFDLDKKSYTVISTWGVTPCYNLLWLGMVRFRKEIPDVVIEMKHQYEMWCPQEVVAEENGLGRGVVQYAKRFGMNIKPLTKDKDKVIFANTAIIQMSKGRIWLPEWATWKKEAEDEVFNWQGHPSEPDDIVDTVSMAANNVEWQNAPELFDEYFQKERAGSYEELPYTINIDGGESGFQFQL